MVGKTETSLHPVKLEHLTDLALVALTRAIANEMANRPRIAESSQYFAGELVEAIDSDYLSTQHSGDTLVICRAIIPERVNV